MSSNNFIGDSLYSGVWPFTRDFSVTLPHVILPPVHLTYCLAYLRNASCGVWPNLLCSSSFQFLLPSCYLVRGSHILLCTFLKKVHNKILSTATSSSRLALLFASLVWSFKSSSSVAKL
eukprot:Gb_40251 [translate_table: standard]